MISLLRKEVKVIVKSISFLLCTVLIIIMFVTQCIPKKWYWYVAPMDDMHLYYTVMKEDYRNGHTQQFASLRKINLDENMKEKIYSTIQLMNPNVSDNEDIENITFSITDEEYTAAMENLDQALGGGSYYVPHYHLDFYSVYCSEAFGVRLLSTKNEIIDRMDSYLELVSKEGKCNKYTYLAGRKVTLTDSELISVTQIYDQLRVAKKTQSDINQLYQLYDSSYISIDKLLGGNTPFGFKYRYEILQANNSLEQAMSIHKSIREDEKVTNAYARYYSDYFSILAGLLPAIFGAFTLLEDRRWKMQELIYSKAIRSITYVVTKFVAILFVFMISFNILAGISTLLFTQFGEKYHMEIDHIAFFKYTAFWVMPTVLFTTAITMFLSVIFKNGIIPLMLQLILFFFSSETLIGEYQIWKPVLRYNRIGFVELYKENLSNIIMNRVIITVASLLLVICTAKLYSTIRKGGNKSLLRRYTNGCIDQI